MPDPLNSFPTELSDPAELQFDQVRVEMVRGQGLKPKARPMLPD